MNANVDSMASRVLAQWACALLLTVSIASLLCAAAPAAASEDSTAAIEYSRSIASEVVSQDETPGMGIAVALDGKIVWAEGFGYADREQEIAVSPRTRFGLGSVTKSLTMVLCGRLVQEGKLYWDAPVEDYLADFPHAGQGITVRLIGAHLSGMGDDWAGTLRYSQEYFSTQEACAQVVQQDLVHEPGTTHLYGTGTFSVIAAVVEQVTEMPFVDAMSRWVLEPLQMADTLPNDPRFEILECTLFYDPREGLEDEVIFDPSHKLAGAGYLSTASDMARFATGIFDDEFLAPKLRAELFADASTQDGTATGFGLGWRITQDEGRPVYYQPGGGPGISSIVVIYPDENVVFVALANHTRGPVGGRVMGETLEAFLSVD